MKPIRTLALAVVATLAVLTAGTTTAGAQEASDEPPKPTPPISAAPLSAHTQHFGTPVTVQPGAFAFAHVSCPAGTVPTGGGARTSGTFIYITDSYANGTDWTVVGKNIGTDFEQTLTAFVVCTVP
ncbi:hypothetical protein ACIPY6_38475 [Streptomyces sp. NPDC090054]|uniref:hypothetical protein n=1 Tax=Streptomyces sp. NPDC090054 TaxID=3365933 RepID=UPI00382975C2